MAPCRSRSRRGPGGWREPPGGCPTAGGSICTSRGRFRRSIPHRIDDAAAAFFGDALFDSLYARNEAGGYAPSLAEGDPEPDGKTLRVTLRAGVRFASGSALRRPRRGGVHRAGALA